MTGVEPLETSSSSNNIITNSNNLKIIPDLRVISKEEITSHKKDVNYSDEIIKMEHARINNYTNKKNAEEGRKLKKELSEAFGVIDKAREQQGIHTLIGFSFSKNDSEQELEKKFKQSEFYNRIKDIKDQDELKIAININIEFSELEKRLFKLGQQKLFHIYHITEKVKDYRQDVLNVGRGYKSSLQGTQQNTVKAIELILNNHYYEIKSQSEAIELIYLAIARGMDLPSPIWEDDKVKNKDDVIYFSKVYLTNLKGNTISKARVKTKKALETQYGVIIPQTIINQYISDVIKAPYRTEKPSLKLKKSK